MTEEFPRDHPYSEYYGPSRQACTESGVDPDELISLPGALPGTQTPRWILVAQKLMENRETLREAGWLSAKELQEANNK